MTGCREVLFEFVARKLESTFSGTTWDRTIPKHVSLAFYFYLTSIASYKSAFGSLAAVIVVMAYLYTSTIVFLFGAQLDAIIRAQATGTLSGAGLDSSERP